MIKHVLSFVKMCTPLACGFIGSILVGLACHALWASDIDSNWPTCLAINLPSMIGMLMFIRGLSIEEQDDIGS